MDIWLYHHNMKKIIFVHIPIFLLGLNYDVIQDDKFTWRIFYLKILTI
jgi:hypothetical protein